MLAEGMTATEAKTDVKPSYIMWLEWREGKISSIRDYRYVRYVVAHAELLLASLPEALPARRSQVSEYNLQRS